MRDRDFDIMVLSRSGERVRHYRIPRAAVPVVLIASTAVLLSSLVVFATMVNHRIRAESLSDLEQENRALRHEVDRLEFTLGEYRQEMSQQVETGDFLRRLANLEPVDRDVWRVGVGGPEPGGMIRLGAVREPERGRLNALASGADELLRQARLQREIYREIEQGFLAQRDRLDHTPSIPPVEARMITCSFGSRPDPFTGERRMHTGLDFSAPQGRPVHATAAGVVILAAQKEQYGLTVEIDHGYGIVTRYGHNSVIKVSPGQTVRRGDVIALVGRSGRATAPHVHYEVLVSGQPVNPHRYIIPGDVMAD